MIIVAEIIHRIIQFFVLIIIIQALLTFFMDPYHPIRRTIDQLVNPFLDPIRRVIPPIANLDFSPVVLIVILQILDMLIYRLFV